MKLQEVKIVNYRGKILNCRLQSKDIDDIFVEIKSGDEIITVEYADGTEDCFDSQENDRLIDFFDGCYIVEAEEIGLWVDILEKILQKKAIACPSYDRKDLFLENSIFA